MIDKYLQPVVKKDRLNKNDIIKKSSEYKQIISSGLRLSSKHLTLYFIDAMELKFGFAVSKQIGKAVKRNFVKRRIKEILRKNKQLLPGKKHIILLAKRGTERTNYKQLTDESCRLFKKSEM